MVAIKENVYDHLPTHDGHKIKWQGILGIVGDDVLGPNWFGRVFRPSRFADHNKSGSDTVNDGFLVKGRRKTKLFMCTGVHRLNNAEIRRRFESSDGFIIDVISKG
jgi:hypothetical protein